MSTETAEFVPDATTAVIKTPFGELTHDAFGLDLTLSQLRERGKKYLTLTCAGADDDEGYNAVHPAWQEMRDTRVAVGKREKELKKPANDYRTKVGEMAKEIVAIVEPIEKHLKKQYDVYHEEKKRIKAEQEAAEKKRIQEIVDEFDNLGVMISPKEVSLMTDEFVATQLVEAREAKRLRDEQRAKEEEEQRLERERLKAEREELDRLRASEAKRQQEEEQRQQAEQRRVQEEQRLERERLQAEEARIKAEADALDRQREELAKANQSPVEQPEQAVESPEIQQPVDFEAAAEIEAETPITVGETTQERPKHLSGVPTAKTSEQRDKQVLLTFCDWLDSVAVPPVSDDQFAQDFRQVFQSEMAEFIGRMRDKIESVFAE